MTPYRTMPTDLVPIVRRLYSSAAGRALPDDLCIIIGDYVALSPKEKLAQLVLDTQVGDFIYLRWIERTKDCDGPAIFGIRKSVAGCYVMLSVDIPTMTIEVRSFDALVSAIASSRLTRAIALFLGFEPSAVFPVTFEASIRNELGLAEKVMPPLFLTLPTPKLIDPLDNEPWSAGVSILRGIIMFRRE